MCIQATPTQESRSERAAVMLTPTEKRAVRFLADVMNRTESDILRDMTIKEIVGRYNEIRERLGLAPAA